MIYWCQVVVCVLDLPTFHAWMAMVRKKSLGLYYSTFGCYIHQMFTNWIVFSGFREEVELSQPIRGRLAILGFFFGSARKKHKKVEPVEFLLHVKCRKIPFSSFRENKVENVSVIQRQGGHLVFPIDPKDTNLVEETWDFAFCQVSANSFQCLHRRSPKMHQQIRGWGGHAAGKIHTW